jgi:predicted phage-related endonuclease
MSADDHLNIHPITDACHGEETLTIFNASDMGSLFGVGFKSLAYVSAKKRGIVPLASDDPENPLMERGLDFEDAARKRVARKYPAWQITKCTDHYVADPIGAKPDNLVIDPAREGVGVLELKVTAEPIHRREWLDDTPPLKYLLQLSTQMMLVPDCTWGAIGELVVGPFTYETNVYIVERNRSAEIRLRTAVAEFWQTFDAGGEPAIDFERDGALIALMFPHEVPGKVIDLSSDNAIRDLLQRRDILKDTEKDVVKRLKECENEIKAKLGDAEGAIVPGWRVTLKTQHRKGYTVEPSSFRVLRTTRHEQETAS